VLLCFWMRYYESECREERIVLRGTEDTVLYNYSSHIDVRLIRLDGKAMSGS
jgi:hypothetical protein